MRWAALVYGSLALLGAGIALALGQSPIATHGFIEELLPGPSGPIAGVVAHGTSLVLGLALGAATVRATPKLVARYAWARELHASLRPVVKSQSGGTLVLLAVASGVSEEIFFRGMLVQVAGLFVAAIAFGLLHQVRGTARWIWAAWATAMGLALGAIFLATGSLLGPVVAHVLVNARNLRFLRDHDVERKPRRLGGILGSA